jgi:hypothetical protein
MSLVGRPWPFRRRKVDLVRAAERLADAVREARSKRKVITSARHFEELDAIVRTVAAERPEQLAAVEASYVRAVAAVSVGAARHGLNANRPRQLFSEWVAEVIGVRSLADLRTFLDDFWSGPKVPYDEVRIDLPRVQHLRRLHDLAAGSSVWRSDPSWPDTTARSALELAADRWVELSGG